MDLGTGLSLSLSGNGCNYLCPVCTCDDDGIKAEIEAAATDLG